MFGIEPVYLLVAVLSVALVWCVILLKVPGCFNGEIGEVSDGYHTFNELYGHRNILFISLMKSHQDLSWVASHHHDGSDYPGYFVAGMSLPHGCVTYHIPNKYWAYAIMIGITAFSHAPVEFDGHTPQDVINRLTELNLKA